jgi:hypothetical protein
VPPIINAVNASSGSSARDSGAKPIDIVASTIVEAPTKIAMPSARPTCRTGLTPIPLTE